MHIGLPINEEEIYTCWIDPGGLSISPDGSYVGMLYLRAGRYRLGIFATKGDECPKEFKLPCGRAGGLTWSPNGDAVAFFAHQTDSPERNVFVLDLVSGDMSAQIPESGWNAFIPSWSPDGTMLAFSAIPLGTSEQRSRLFVVSLQTNETRQLTTGEHMDVRPHLSPDGRRLVFRREWEIWCLDLIDGTERQLITEFGHDFELHFKCFSPDGSQIVMQRGIVDGGQILIVDVGTGAVQALTDATNADIRPSWSPRGDAIAFVRNRERVVITAPDGTVLWEAAPSNGRIYGGASTGVQWAHNAEVLTFLDRDSNAWIATEGAPAKRVTNFQERPRVKQQPKQVICPSTDGAQVPALLLEPDGFVAGRDPAVVWLHGGPWCEAAMDLNGPPFCIYLTAMLDAGFAVLLPDYRGSIGHGAPWEWVRPEQRGIADVDDVVAAKRYLVDNGLANPSRVAVAGYSYGGYLTLMALTRNAENWACAASLWGLLDPVRFRDGWALDNDEMPDLTSRSPLNLMHEMHAPLLILHGAHDTMSTNEEVGRASEAIQRQGSQFEVHIFEDVHGLPLHTEEAAKLLVAFLKKHTSDRGA